MSPSVASPSDAITTHARVFVARSSASLAYSGRLSLLKHAEAVGSRARAPSAFPSGPSSAADSQRRVVSSERPPAATAPAAPTAVATATATAAAPRPRQRPPPIVMLMLMLILM